MAVHGYLQCRQSGNFCPDWNVVGLHKLTIQAIQRQMCITHHTQVMVIGGLGNATDICRKNANALL